MAKNDILELSKSETLVLGEDTSIKAGIDVEDVDFVAQVLTTNLYSEPIPSVLREITSNSLDATVEAGSDKPVIISNDVDDNGSFISFQDFGTGISEDRFYNVFVKIGKSTKRADSQAVGFFGLGRLSILSYTDTFYVDTVYDGILYKYIVYKNGLEIKFDKLSEQPTDLKNGTTVKVYYKSYNHSSLFEKGIRQQLGFFDNVYYKGFDNIDNNFKIYSFKSWSYHSWQQNDSPEIKIKLGPCTYPINFNTLGIGRINAPIYLNFEIGELPVAPNRESIIYSDKAKKLILDKLKKVCTDIVNKYNSTNRSMDNLGDFHKAFTSNNRYFWIDKDTKQYYLGITSEIENHSNDALLNPIFSPLPNHQDYGFHYISLENLLSKFHTKPRSLTKNGLYSKNNYIPIHLREHYNYIDTTGVKDLQPAKKRRYLASKDYSLFSFGDTMKLFPTSYEKYNNYYWILKLSKIPKDQWRKTIQIFQQEIKKYIDSTFNITHWNDIIVPDTFEPKIARGKNQTNWQALRKANGEIVVKEGRYPEKSGNSNIVFENKTVKADELGKEKCLVVYSDDRDKLENIVDMCSNGYNYYNYSRVSPKIKIRTGSKKVLSLFEEIDNYVNYDEFMKGEYTILKKVAVALLANTLKENYKYLFENKNYLKSFKQDFVDTINKTENLISEYAYRFDSKFKNEFLAMMEEKQQYHLPSLEVYNKCKEYCEQFAWLEHFRRDTTNYYSTERTLKDTTIPFAVEVAKFKKIRLDAENYRNPKVEEDESSTDNS